MEPAPLLECALTVIFFVNDADNGRRPQLFWDLLTSADLEIAFTEAEAYPIVDIDISLDRVESTWAGRNTSTTCELVQAVNRLRRSKGIEYLIPDEVLRHLQGTIQSLTGHKRKYEELLDQTEQEARQRAQAKRVSELVGREERAKRRDGLRALGSQLNEKTRELAATKDSLQREQVDVKRLKRSLECQICRAGRWETVTGCGHLFCAQCIKQWLEVWVEDNEGYLVLREPHCPTCRAVLSAKDLKRVYVYLGYLASGRITQGKLLRSTDSAAMFIRPELAQRMMGALCFEKPTASDE
jgi:rubrerythrin